MAERARTWILLIAGVAAMGVSASAQQQSARDVMALDWRAVTDDAEAIFTAPARWDAGQWAVAGLVAVSAVAAYTQDEGLRDFAQRSRADADPEPWMTVGDYYGSGLVGGAAGLAMYAGGLGFEDEWTRVTGRMVVQSIAYAGALNAVLKTLLGRARPFTGEGAASFRFLMFDFPHTSMPSGHSTQAFALSSTLAARIDHPAGYAVLYGLAGLTAAQRILTDVHWLSDTVVGSAIGLAIGLAVVQLEDERIAATEPLVPLAAGMRPHQPLIRWNMPF